MENTPVTKTTKLSKMSAVCMWDFRHTASKTNKDDIIKAMKSIAKKWAFQLETSATGYVHFQGRFSLIKKHRKAELMTMWEAFTMPLPEYLEPSNSEAYKTDDFFYTMKDETRTEGPWTNKTELDPSYIPKQYRGKMDNLYPFQKQIFDSANIFDDRIINLIYDDSGNNGKSTIASLCELVGNGIDLPPINDMKELIQVACDICVAKETRNPSPVFVDMPRAMDKARLNGIYTAIEQIKKGKLYDTRYHYKEWWIDAPQIWVFSNMEPDENLLSRDRWKIWTINSNKELVAYETEEKNPLDL
nr:putative replication associated protein [Crucivirus sp.]